MAGKSEDLRLLIRRLDANCVNHLQGATNVCTSRTHFEVTPDHLLLRMLDESGGDVGRILETFNVDRANLRRAVQKGLNEARTGHTGKPAVSDKLVDLFAAAGILADEYGFEQIRSGLFLLVMALNPGHTSVGEHTPEFDRLDADQLRDHFVEIVSAGGGASADAGATGSATPGPAGTGDALAQFTIDLTEKAASGQIDPVFGRDKEIRRMIDVFARRRKNNPILVGEPGTGKTAIVEGLALRIVAGDVPPTSRGVKLISLDLGLLQAGASVKGEFENRLKNVIREIKASDTPVITFIDEAHMLIGAGGAAGGSDASNLLKPALARGELRTVACTTWAEYKKYFEKDAALERRFQLIKCDEPSVDDTVVMLRGLKDRYERHHGVFLLDEAVQAAAKLSARYISGRFLPDKAVDLIDTAAARVAVSVSTRPGTLDDFDRRLNHLDTAIAAMERDAAGGMPLDSEAIAEMQSSRAKIMTDREALETRWKAELEIVTRVAEQRKKLSVFAAPTNGENRPVEETPPASAEVDSLAPAAAEAEGGAAAATAEAPAAVDEAEVRKSIDAGLAELRELQGDAPLVHAHVDAAAVASVVADWTGIPVGNMVKDEIAATLNMEEKLQGRVVGQDHALHTVAEKLRIARAGIGNPDQPLGVFLCVGPSGVGKTELALSIANLLYGGEQFLTTINMSEFMEKHTVSQLKGSPPGYVGYGEGGVLTEAVRQHPYSVVLLDEVEKAHPDVMNLFYQVFDKGSLADGEGRVINFRNTVIILTSNLGTDAIQQMCESGDEFDLDDLKEAIYPHLREHFKPALVARMTVIPFFTLGQEILEKIARLKMKKVGKRLAEVHKMRLEVDDAVYTAMAGMCSQVDIGARQIDHLLDRAVLPGLSRALLTQMAEGDEMPREVRISVNEEAEFGYAFSG